MSQLMSFDTSGKNYRKAKRKLILFFGTLGALALWQELGSQDNAPTFNQAVKVYNTNGVDTTALESMKVIPKSEPKIR